MGLGAALTLASVHLFAYRLKFLDGTPRSRWLSLAGGVAVAYIFVHLLHELNELNEVLTEATEGTLLALERHIYLISLVGLVAFYGLERAAKGARKAQGSGAANPSQTLGVYYLHLVCYALYNVLVGYLLAEQLEHGALELMLFTLAMGFHFLVNDYGLRAHFSDAFLHQGRWILSAAVLVGWGVSLFGTVSEVVLSILLAFLSGGVILNTLKEELPEERESRYWAFVTGAVAYTALLLLV